MLRILQVGLGPLGQKIAADLHGRGLGRVVAAVDPGPDKVGRDVAELVAGAKPGVRVVSSLDGVGDFSGIRCAIVTTLSDLELCMDTFRGLLGRGAAVVSTCEELSWPWLRHPILAQELAELAVKKGGRILGTGVNPGFLMDALPVAATTACGSVRSIRIERVQDAGPRRIPFQRKIGTGLDDEEFARRKADGSLRHVGLAESLHFVAHYLGMHVERWEETLEAVKAEQDVESGLGLVTAGRARGVRQVATGWVDGKQALELVFHAAVGEPEPFDKITIEGEPSLELVIPGGVHGDTATSAIVLNSIRPLLAAPPGLHTMASIPLQGCSTPDDFAAR